MSTLAVMALDPATYRGSALHGSGSAWPEKNCYADVWIDTLHALGLEPEAMLPFTVGLDFEGDQWTFFKPPHGDLSLLYGIAVHELNLWRGNLLEHAARQVADGRLVFAEADAYWLPDAAGTDYQRQHTKSTIVINSVDVQARELGYFHNAGYHALKSDDFIGLFRLDQPLDTGYMPFFAEFVRIDRLVKKPVEALVTVSIDLLRGHLKTMPHTNPLTRFSAQFPSDVKWLQGAGMPLYHGYAFATLRQLGANFDLAAAYLAWLTRQGETGLELAQKAFHGISSGAQALVLKTARAVQGGRAADFSELLDSMSASWALGTDVLRQRYL